jgi:hypothetical protein
MSEKKGWRPIRSLPQPKRSPVPSTPTPSNSEAARAVRIASSPGGIDGRQQPLKKQNSWSSKWPT